MNPRDLSCRPHRQFSGASLPRARYLGSDIRLGQTPKGQTIVLLRCCNNLLASDDGSAGQRSQSMLFVDLQADVLLAICDHLPFAALLVFRLQVCRSLHYRPELGRMRLRHDKNSSLTQWKEATFELKSIGLAREDRADGVDANGHHGGELGSDDPAGSLSAPRGPTDFISDSIVGWDGAKSLKPKLQQLGVAMQVVLMNGSSKEYRLFKRVLAPLGLAFTPQSSRADASCTRRIRSANSGNPFQGRQSTNADRRISAAAVGKRWQP